MRRQKLVRFLHGLLEFLQKRPAVLCIPITLAMLAGLIWLDYCYGWTRLGTYRVQGKVQWGKTLWDWFELLFVPTALALAVWFLNRAERQTEREIAHDQARETALQNYFDRMTELLLEKELRRSEPNTEVRDIARARTLAVLRFLDGTRKGTLMRFLYEANLIGLPAVVDLHGADLRGADLSMASLDGTNLGLANLQGANLVDSNLSGANLSIADLGDANLNGVILSGAHLHGTNLSEATLSGAILLGVALSDAHLAEADLREAYLGGANLSGANLSGAKLNRRTTLPDGTQWTPDTDLARFTDPDHPDFWQPD